MLKDILQDFPWEFNTAMEGAQTDMQYFITVYLWLKVPFWKTFNRLIFNGDIINDSCGIELHLPLFR